MNVVKRIAEAVAVVVLADLVRRVCDRAERWLDERSGRSTIVFRQVEQENDE